MKTVLMGQYCTVTVPRTFFFILPILRELPGYIPAFCLLFSPQVVALAEYQVGLGVAGRSHFAESAVAAAALEAVFVPVHVQGPQQVPVILP